MSYSELFRPQNPQQLIGESQIRIAKSLLSLIEENRFPRELLFIGPSGSGKTTIARMYAKKLLGEHVSIEEAVVTINCAADTGIDNIREVVINRLPYKPLIGSYRVYFLDEVHKLSVPAQNALLAEIEPLPSHAIIIAATTEPAKLIDTLKSRFNVYTLQSPSVSELKKKQGWILKKIGKKPVDFDRGVLQEIVEISGGNVRVLDRYMEQLLSGSYSGEEKKEEDRFPYELIIKGLSLEKAFAVANKESSYSDLNRFLCNYAIKVLLNPRTAGSVRQRAIAVMKTFGSNPFLQDRIEFFSKLVSFYDYL